MAAQFGQYSPVVPLGLSWTETIQLIQSDCVTPVDITGYAVRAQLRNTPTPVIDPILGAPNPILEITTAAYYSVPPAWPVIAKFSVPTPTNGSIILQALGTDFSSIVSPTNAKAKLYWDVRLVNPSTGASIPVVVGKVVFLPAVTI